MAEKQTWYVVLDGVLDNRVGYLGASEDAALAVWRKSSKYRPGAARAVPRDGRFSLVSAKTRSASALSDTGLSLTEAIARYRHHQGDAAMDGFARTVLIGDDRTRAVPVGRRRDVWELTFTPSHIGGNRSRGPHSAAYYLLYQEKPAGLLHERTDLYDEPEAEAAVRQALQSAAVGSYAVVWRAPYDERAPWQSWSWERWRSYLKTGPRDVTRVEPVMALSAVPRQPYLDQHAEETPIHSHRYPVLTDMDVTRVGDQYRATGMHVGETYEGWGRSERAAVNALKAAIEAADPVVEIRRARRRR